MSPKAPSSSSTKSKKVSSKGKESSKAKKKRASPNGNNNRKNNGLKGKTNLKGECVGDYPSAIGVDSDTSLEQLIGLGGTNHSLQQLPYQTIYFHKSFRILCPGCGYLPSQDPLVGLKTHCVGAGNRGGCPAFMSMFCAHLDIAKTKDGKKYCANFRGSFMADQAGDAQKRIPGSTEDDPEHWRELFDKQIKSNKGSVSWNWWREQDIPIPPLRDDEVKMYANAPTGLDMLSRKTDHPAHFQQVKQCRIELGKTVEDSQVYSEWLENFKND